PLADKDRAEKVNELGNLLFERQVTLEAARRWNDVLGARLAATGIKFEAGVYQDELAQLQSVSAGNARRVNALTGQNGPGPATGGEIGSTRAELDRARSDGTKRLAIQIAAILLAAFLLPRFLLWALRRALGASRGDEGSLALSALGAI